MLECLTGKLKAMSGRSIEDISFYVRAVHEIQSISYGSKSTSQPLSEMMFRVHLKNYRSEKDVVHIEQLIYYRTCLFSKLEMHRS